MAEPSRRVAGRRSTDPELAVLAEWREGVDEKLDAILLQSVKTNGRVSELEVKERIRQDREEQRAIRLAAAEAAKFRVEEQAVEHQHHRTGWRVTLEAVALGSVLSFVGAAVLHFLHLV